MQSLNIFRRSCVLLGASTIVACHANDVQTPEITTPASCTGIDFGRQPAALTLPQTAPSSLPIRGFGTENQRYTGEVAVRGTLAYTSTWSVRQVAGNKVNIWDVSGNVPVLVDSVIAAGATTTGDVAVSDDGKLLVVASERTGGSIFTYDLTDPRRPRLLSRFTNSETDPGVHTAEIGRVNGKLYAFLSIDPGGGSLARLVVVDLSAPEAPKQVYSKVIGSPYVHDTFVRDGLLFLALWNDGIEIWDIGGCGTGASPETPRVLGGVKTVNGEAHNIWWLHDAAGSKRYAFVGEEGPGSIGSTSRGDIHVVDVSDPSTPKEVAFYHLDGAGTHNFSVDEAHGVLYAAYYNAGVRALDIRGDLGNCPTSQRETAPGLNLPRCDLRLMGRELAVGLTDLSGPKVYIWGVQYLDGSVYASDMLNGIWKLGSAK